MKPDEPTWTPPPRDGTQPPAELLRIFRLFHPYRGRLTLVGLLVGASSLVSVASPFLLREILDTAIPQGRTGLLSLLALGMILTAVMNSVFGVLQTLISTTVGQRVMHDLRTAVYAQLQRMPLAFFTRTRTGEVQSRIANDIGGMQATVTSTATSLVSNLTAVIATVVAMLALDWRLTLVSLALLPVFVWISRRVGRERKKITTQRQKQMAAMAATVTESLSVSGILLGRTMGRADSLTEGFAEESERLVDLEVRSSMAGRWRMSTIGIVMAAMPAVIYWAAGLALQSGGPAVSIGTLVAFVSLQQGLFRPAVSLLSTGVQMQTSLALFQRIFEYLDLEVDITEPENPVRLEKIRGEIRFEDVDFSYDEKSGPTLSGVDVVVAVAAVSPSSDPPAPASPRSATWYRGSTTSQAAGSRSTASMYETWTSTRSPGPSAWSPRRHTSSTPRSPRTCASPSRTRPTPRSRRPLARHRSTTTSPRCPTATTPSSASAATASRAARNSAWPSPARFCATRPSSSSTRRPAPSTPAPSSPCRRRSTHCPPGAPPSRSRTDSPPCATRTRSSSWTAAGPPSAAATRNCSSWTAAMRRSSAGTPNSPPQQADREFRTHSNPGVRGRFSVRHDPRA